MDNIATMIEQAVKLSGERGYQNSYRPLGGGELNDTYVLDFADNKKLVLRVARYEDQDTLANEANALRLLSGEHTPTLVFFDENSRINNRPWILESYLAGTSVSRLDTAQFYSLGSLLAAVHKTQVKNTKVHIWQRFLEACRSFGDEAKLLNHPDDRIRRLIIAAKNLFESAQPLLDTATPTLIHGDATPSNVLVNGATVSLIDWELSCVSDPMAEFSTIFYDDMEYNKGKWRVHINPEDRSALFEGYKQAGGVIDQERLQLWMLFDKLGAAVFLYWRIYESGRGANSEQLSQYQLDLANLIQSLETSFSDPRSLPVQ